MPHCRFREMTVRALDVRVDMSSGPGSIGPRNCPCFAAVDPQDTELPELRGHRQHTFKEEIRDSIASRSCVVRDAASNVVLGIPLGPNLSSRVHLVAIGSFTVISWPDISIRANISMFTLTFP